MNNSIIELKIIFISIMIIITVFIFVYLSLYYIQHAIAFLVGIVWTMCIIAMLGDITIDEKVKK